VVKGNNPSYEKNTSESAEESLLAVEPPVHHVTMEMKRNALAFNLGGIAEALPFVPWWTEGFFVFFFHLSSVWLKYKIIKNNIEENNFGGTSLC